eukprot:364588-Chlamydomonas_euryale.AAC.13
MRIPSVAARPVPTMTAVGVARPSAQGHAMTTTEMPNSSAKRNGVWPSGSHEAGYACAHPQDAHTIHVASAMQMTTGTNTADTVSANACTGALLSCACCTSRTICDNVVSPPTRVARISSMPLPPATVPPVRPSPGFLNTGRGSPVIMASSTCASPTSTSPSVGTRPPGSTRSTSPRWIRCTGTSCVDTMPPSGPSSTTVAASGASCSSFVMASEVRPLAAHSRYLPMRMMEMIIALVSKKSVGMYVPSAWCALKWWNSTERTE